MENNTIFDDVFQTIKEKMPELLIPLINEAFGTTYALDAPILRGENEHHTANGKIITDSYLIIGSRKYHLECQSTEDSTMILRMIEYDFAIGLEYAEKEDEIYQIRFPHSCVLYLRGDNRKNCIDLKLVFPDGQSVNYKVPVLRMQWYSLEELLEKNMVMLLPYYIIRYEKLREQLEIDEIFRKELYTEYRAIETYLEKHFLESGQEKGFRDMMELINRITGYIFSKSEKIKEGLGEIMGGQVLELESDRLMKRGSVEKLSELVAKRMRKGDTPEQIAELLEEDLELIQKIYTVIQQNGIDCEPSIICEKVLEK